MELEEYVQRLADIVERAQIEHPPMIQALANDCRGDGRTKRTVERDVTHALRGLRGAEGDLGNALADAVHEDDFNNGRHLIYLPEGRFWAYDGRVWAPVTKAEVEGAILARLNQMIEHEGVTMSGNGSMASLVKQAVSLLVAKCARSDDPLRLREPPKAILNCANGEYDIEKKQVFPHRYDSYLRVALDVKYDAKAKAPAFEQFVREIMGDDEDRARHLMEALAMIMSPRKPIAGMFLFIGGGSNGKSLLTRLLTELMGPAVRSDRIHSIGHNNFAMNALVGKSALIDDDVDFRTDFPIAEAKRISEGKVIGSEVKGGAHFDFLCEVSPVMLSNGYPPVRDTSWGFERRAYVIPFYETFLLQSEIEQGMDGRRADTHLIERLRSEKSGMLNLLLSALQRLEARGHFDEPKASRKARDEWRKATDNVLAFVRDHCIETRDHDTRIAHFHQVYQQWCRLNGFRAKSRANVTNSLKDAGFVITKPGNVPTVKQLRVPPVSEITADVGAFKPA